MIRLTFIVVIIAVLFVHLVFSLRYSHLPYISLPLNPSQIFSIGIGIRFFIHLEVTRLSIQVQYTVLHFRRLVKSISQILNLHWFPDCLLYLCFC